MSQVIDMHVCQEFMKETLGRIEKEDLVEIASLLEVKSAFLQENLHQVELPTLTKEELTAIFKTIFITNRKVKLMFETYSLEEYKTSFYKLLYDEKPVKERFQNFMDSHKKLDTYLRYDLAGELLHYNNPDKYWLWNRWVWDPEINTGALPLVVSEEFNLSAATYSEMYMNVGKAITFVHAMAEAVEFQFINRSLFGTDVYLSCVYVIYAYTVFKVKMTDEFNKVMPPLAEFSKRILGVHQRKSPVLA
ncbi:MAG: hypothetical protein L3J29_05245 [Cyclobacteriaceae bacterium]|nr:hypothetical protein [Cyclobacteriaceae bacterium]